MELNDSNNFLSISSVEEGSKEEEEQTDKKDSNLEISNIKKINIQYANNSKDPFNKINEGTKSDKEYILKLRDKLKNNTIKIKNKKILILPPPENELIDKHSNEINLKDESLGNKGYIKLMNPDNMNLNIKETDINNNLNEDKNIISINQKDIIDKNWEMKYINKMIKKDMNKAFTNEEEIEDKNKLNNKKRKRDKIKNEELDDQNMRTKYDKISTKKRYGW